MEAMVASSGFDGDVLETGLNSRFLGLARGIGIKKNKGGTQILFGFEPTFSSPSLEDSSVMLCFSNGYGCYIQLAYAHNWTILLKLRKGIPRRGIEPRPRR